MMLRKICQRLLGDFAAYRVQGKPVSWVFVPMENPQMMPPLAKLSGGTYEPHVNPYGIVVPQDEALMPFPVFKLDDETDWMVFGDWLEENGHDELRKLLKC